MKQVSRETKIQGIISSLLPLMVISGCQLGQPFLPTPTPTATSTIIPSPTAIGGGLIAFVTPTGFNICFIHIDGSNRNCLDSTGNDLNWSPDGNKLVFHSLRDENSGLYVMNADGSRVVRLSHNSEIELDRYPAWSPDGKHIAFASIESFIYVMDADGTNAARLSGVLCNHPTWSPDGKHIAVSGQNLFISDNSACNVTGIYLMDANGANKIILTKLTGGTIIDVAWSPDGKHIAFTSDMDASPSADSFHVDIYSIDPNGSNLTRLTHDGEGGSDLTWSPDSQHIAFARYDNTMIYIMKADGSNITTLTEGLHPAWQP